MLERVRASLDEIVRRTPMSSTEESRDWCDDTKTAYFRKFKSTVPCTVIHQWMVAVRELGDLCVGNLGNHIFCTLRLFCHDTVAVGRKRPRNTADTDEPTESQCKKPYKCSEKKNVGTLGTLAATRHWFHTLLFKQHQQSPQVDNKHEDSVNYTISHNNSIVVQTLKRQFKHILQDQSKQSINGASLCMPSDLELHNAAAVVYAFRQLEDVHGSKLPLDFDLSLNDALITNTLLRCPKVIMLIRIPSSIPLFVKDLFYALNAQRGSDNSNTAKLDALLSCKHNPLNMSCDHDNSSHDALEQSKKNAFTIAVSIFET